MVKKIKNLKYGLSIILISTGCQTLKTGHTPAQPQIVKPQIVTPPAPPAAQNPVPPTPPTAVTPSIVSPQIVVPQINSASSIKGVPKFGIIFSGGGAKTWAHVGVLKEMQRYKFPVVSVAGIEWGSVVAAAFAENASVNEVEWELAKFKGLDDWQDFVKTAFAKKSTLDFKMPFVCPSVNLKNKTSYLLNRGPVDQFLLYCIPSAGVTKPYGNSVANLADLQSVALHLKATGVNKIILINVISTKTDTSFVKSLDSAENQIWTQFAALANKKTALIDDIIDIEMDDMSINDFDKRRDIMAKGAELGYTAIKKLAEKYRL